MPTNEHLVLCGAAAFSEHSDATHLNLNLHGSSANVRLEIGDISRRLLANISDIHADLLEIASYIYAADSAIPRGGNTDAQLGARWRRKLRFVIPVRQPNLWSSDPVLSALVETISFLSDDDYEFEFRLLENPQPVEGYFAFTGDKDVRFTPDRVILFSGGLDSLAGTIEELVAHGKKVALVSHRSASKIVNAQKYLIKELQTRFGADRVLHVPVWAHLKDSLGKEPTHRTRSFLFAALGAVTAKLLDRQRIFFFENGVVSLNLPPVAQVVGARATRTTHPQALAGFRRVLSGVLGHPFDVSNPFAWMTKSEVIERISQNGCSDLIRHTRSCTRVHAMTTLHTHCGQCSQCVDRRFAVLAAERENDDPADAYKVDLLLGERQEGPDREMALAFVRSASSVNQMKDVEFFAHYGETSRIVGFFDEPTNTAASRIFSLYQRHAGAVCRVFDAAIKATASKIREGSLPADCLLSLVVGRSGEDSTYHVLSPAAGQTAAVAPEIRMAIDEGRKRVVFDRWGEIKGASAQLIIALAQPFRQAMRNKLVPERYPFLKASELMRQISCKSDETLRRQIFRCRNKIGELASNAGDPTPSLDAVLENNKWHGYRVNPDRIRIVAMSELSRSE
jgi:7-cyano-7-deazaguanine synthase in queuosine biosynthesis